MPPTILDQSRPSLMYRWDVPTLAWVVWDGSLTAGALIIGAVTQSGTWTVQPGNTANTTAWKVDGSAVTQPVSIATMPSTPVTGTFFQTTQPVSDPSTSRSDTYTALANGVTITATTTPYRAFAIQVVGTNGPASLWDVRLEGSLDGTNFSQILQHVNATGNAEVLFSGALQAPALYLRSRCAGLTLGGATNIVVTIAGIQ